MEQTTNHKIWVLSVTASILFATLLVFKWYSIHQSYDPNDNQLASQEIVEQKLDEFGVASPATQNARIRTPVGIFIQALEFESANDVSVSGYVWQVVPNDAVKDIEHGLVFPDAVGDMTLDEAYRFQSPDGLVVGWYFEANLRQAFDYRDYPLDHKTVWVRLWPKTFNSQTVLVPALDTYHTTGLNDEFGISEAIVLDGWRIEETFFDYAPTQFDTNFGFGESFEKSSTPELKFNVVLNRQLLQAFMVNITILLVSMALLYSYVAMITSDQDLMGDFDMNVGGTVTTCSALFFVILLAHIQLREIFPGSGIVYMEYFYIASYFFILMVSIYIYLFYKNPDWRQSWLFANEGRVLKVAFWPAYLMLNYAATVIHYG